jgi:hypothetical protein
MQNKNLGSYEPNLGPYPTPGKIKVLDSYIYTDYESLSSVGFIDKEIPITQINDLIIYKDENLNKTDASLDISEPSIVISLASSGEGYFHIMYNILAEVEILQAKFPEAKIKVLGLGPLKDLKFFKTFCDSKGISEAYKIKESDFISLEENNYIRFKNSYFINSDYNPIFSSISGYNFNYGTKTDLKEWGSGFSKKMKDRFLKEASKEKIFISRLYDNDLYRRIVLLMEKQMRGSILSEEELSLLSNRSVRDYPGLKKRLMQRDQEVLLEKMFEDFGYKIINAESYGDIFSQARLFNQARYIVGLSGASFINCCFCDPGAEVLVLNSSDYYTFPHDKFVESFGIKSYLCPSRKPWIEETYTAKEIFNEVLKKYPQFLGMV